MNEGRCHLFSNIKLSHLKKVEHISTRQVLHHKEKSCLIFKDIDESNDVRMLANLQNLNFSLLKFEIFIAHFLLSKYFHSAVLFCLPMLNEFD